MFPARTLFLACLIGGGIHAWALDPAKGIDQFQVTSWTTEHGLPNDHINAVTQTRDGYLWIATPTGLVRFDGLRFTVFDKRNAGGWPSDDIAGLLSGSDGSLWITHSPRGLTEVRHGSLSFGLFTPERGRNCRVCNTAF